MIANLDHLRGVVGPYTIMKTGLPFRHEMDTGMARWIVRNKSSQNSCLTHHGLLCTFPAIGVSQDELCAILQGIPQGTAAGVSLLNVLLRALVQVS